MSTEQLHAKQQGDFRRHYSGLFYLLFVLAMLIYFLVAEAFSIPVFMQLALSFDSRYLLYFLCFAFMWLCALTPAPTEIIALGNALLFPPWEAFLLTWISASVCAYIGYEIGRLNAVKSTDGRQSSKVKRCFDKHGYLGLVVMRLLPFVPFFALNIVSGVLRLKRVRYMIITAVTIIPAVAALTFFPHIFISR